MFNLVAMDKVLKDDNPLVEGDGEGELPQQSGQPHLLRMRNLLNSYHLTTVIISGTVPYGIQ